MVALVRIALSKPYTFVVMALLILIFGVMSVLRTPIDIFPNIGIPVISVIWQGYHLACRRTAWPAVSCWFTNAG